MTAMFRFCRLLAGCIDEPIHPLRAQRMHVQSHECASPVTHRTSLSVQPRPYDYETPYDDRVTMPHWLGARFGSEEERLENERSRQVASAAGQQQRGQTTRSGYPAGPPPTQQYGGPNAGGGVDFRPRMSSETGEPSYGPGGPGRWLVLPGYGDQGEGAVPSRPGYGARAAGPEAALAAEEFPHSFSRPGQEGSSKDYSSVMPPSAQRE